MNEEIKAVMEEYKSAIKNFENADEDFVETAIMYLNAVKSKLNLVFKYYKNKENCNG